MNSKHFISLFKNAIISFIIGLIYVFVVVIFCNDILGEQPYIHLIIGSILTFISCGVINVIVLPIITISDKKIFETKLFRELLLRYMPIFAAPFIILFSLFVLTEGAEYEIIMHVFIVMLVSYTNLYVYLSFVKYANSNDNTIGSS